MSDAPAPGASARLACRIVASAVATGRERRIEVDQTNVSVVVDESVIVKWLVPPVPDPHPGLAVLEHLRQVGFADMPAFHGVDATGGEVRAIVSEYVAGARDGWDWFVDELTGWADGTVGRDRVLASAASLGALGARLHLALATPSAVIPQPIGELDLAKLTPGWWRQLDEALGVSTGDASDVLHRCEGAIRDVFAAAPASGATVVCPVHGDLHVGQVLRAGERLVVVDFDGNPLLDPAERHVPRPPAVDVASLVQSVDHAGRVAQRRRPAAAARLDPVVADATTETLRAYREALHSGGRSALLDERLVAPLRVAQELHEIVYAAHHLPRWAYVPAATLTAMFPRR